MVGKRRTLTADDLLRMQEDGPARKRPFMLEDDSDSEGSVPRAQSKRRRNREHSSGSESEEEITDDDEDSEDEAFPQPNSMPDVDDRFSSRISIVPKASLALARTPLTTQTEKASSFLSFGISSALLGALYKMSIKAPTEIQAACVPPLLQGEFCLGIA